MHLARAHDRTRGYEFLEFVRSIVLRLQSTIAAGANDESMLSVEQLAQDGVVVGLTIHHMDKRRTVFKDSLGLCDGRHPSVLFVGPAVCTVWNLLTTQATLPHRVVAPRPRAQSHHAKRDAIEPHRHRDVSEQRPARVLAESLSRGAKLKDGGVLHTKHGVPTRTSAHRRFDVRRQSAVGIDAVVAQKPVESFQLRLGHGVWKPRIWLGLERSRYGLQSSVEPSVAQLCPLIFVAHRRFLFPHTLR